MKKFFFYILFITVYFFGFGQTPDVLITEYNTTMPLAEWKFSFVHITDIHIGYGATTGDFGTQGYYDTLSGIDTGYNVTALRHAINWINEKTDSLKIKFVIITGDISDSGELSELLKFKQLMDSLTIPYVPLIGNHDVWPHADATEAYAPVGDSIFNILFASHFEYIKNFFSDWDDGTRLTQIYNTDASCFSYFQNFAFVYGSYLFILCDFSSRSHAPFGFPGVAPDANLFNFPGGSYQWLQQKINDYPNKGYENILIFAHFPLIKDAWAFVNSFSQGEYTEMTNFLGTYRDNVGMWCAGHLHRDSEYGITKWIPDGIIAQGIETDGNAWFPYGHFRIIKVWDTVTSPANVNYILNEKLFKIYPNPNTGVFKIYFNTSSDNLVDITDIMGRPVYRTYFKSNMNKSVLQIDLLNFFSTYGLMKSGKNGIYYVRVKNEKACQVEKIIIF